MALGTRTVVPTAVKAVACRGLWASVKEYLAHKGTTTTYRGDGGFLVGPSQKTESLKRKLAAVTALEKERGGVVSIDTKTVAGITSHRPGYLDKANEVIVGLQTDEPLKRAIKPFGGWRVVKAACEAYGYDLDKDVEHVFRNYRKTHNDAVFDCYSEEMRAARSNKLLTGLPDAYGRGRIVGDYRRIALFGVDELVSRKKDDRKATDDEAMTEEIIREREEIAEQIKALEKLEEMAASYGFDISKPAKTAKEAVQWVYFGYLGTVKANDGAATSLPRLDVFFDTYVEEDLRTGVLKDESEAQELIDQFFLKLRMVNHLRTPEYNSLFSGDPIWATLAIGGSDDDKGPLVAKTSFRFLQTLYNLGRHPEPNLTVLWALALPEGFKDFSARVSADTSSIQFENDDLMRGVYGSDYAISCCVSAMGCGEQTQFFGARANLPKLLLYSINGGVDEMTRKRVGPPTSLDVCDEDGYLDYPKVRAIFESNLDWIARLYANTMNIIHYSHDKYFYEALPFALHDARLRRFVAFGASGIATVADSLAAIKYGKVMPIRENDGVATSFRIDTPISDLPRYGTDDDRADDVVKDVVFAFSSKLKKQRTYRNSEPTLSLLTITSNVVYGKQTGDTPDGRRKGECFSPGSNPYHGRDAKGALASLNSVAKIPYVDGCQDGISNTFSIAPAALGKTQKARADNLVALLDGYFEKGGHHINVNCLDRDMLVDAMEHPEQYPNLVVRVSGYAVMFQKLTREQQEDVISRTYHQSI
ncbi:hypothetical protein CTAYLR_004512 [Chrysophaeum taylorii]|uniref:formate C-acetyltransferase n=1 Tax=Chrysophaeum taylorii TaxID=2483200 RepID=A0AAD7UBT2_9STRA|nr:hypothetical protein CTAYLR_004512 [Chrysophaeum taylorii]